MNYIVVTGGTGFIGSHICEFLNKKYAPDYQIIAIDDLSGSTQQNIANLDHVLFRQADLRDPVQVDRSLKEITSSDNVYCYYLASAAHENRSFFTPNENMSRNDQAYRIFLTELIKTGALRKIVLFSSIGRYGHGWNDNTPPFEETLPPYPADPYSVSKVAMEFLTECQSKIFDFDYTILVPHNVFGERQRYFDPYRNVLGIWMNLILQGKSPVIFGDGQQTRAFSYIGDNIESMVESMFTQATNSKIVNIGTDKEYSLDEAWGALAFVSKTGISPIYTDERPGEVKHASCTVALSKEILKYKEKIGFSVGLEMMWKWVESQGPRPFIYIDKFELENQKIPKVWKTNFSL